MKINLLNSIQAKHYYDIISLPPLFQTQEDSLLTNSIFHAHVPQKTNHTCENIYDHRSLATVYQGLQALAQTTG